MTDIDLERLGSVWRQQPDPEELERLQRSAAAVSRRARLAQFVDVGAAILVALVVMVLVVSSGRVETVALGGAAILVLLVSNIRLRRLRQVELRSMGGSTEDMLDQAIERVENTLKYKRFSLVAIGPALAAGYLVAWSTDRSVGSLVDSVRNLSGVGRWWAVAWLIVFAVIAIYALLSMRRSRSELERVAAMREVYRQESE
ncbi:MAG TPA: hypothetical protein VGX37_02200 [Allosphingosinicella sp.]|jgi:hypothetical protein|nr:hypothetical protein [Allosphingosinicella sp.]